MEIGNVVFEGIDCIYSREWKTIYLSPVNERDFFKLELYKRRHFFIKFSRGCDNTIAYIDNSDFYKVGTYILNAEFIFSYVSSNPDDSLRMTCMEFTGKDLDAVYNPTLHYYRETNHGRDGLGVDLLYSHEKVESFTLALDDKSLQVEIYLGNILKNGVLGDNKLHTQLVVSFDQTEDVLFIYRIYSLVVRFLQILLYKRKVGFRHIEVLNETDISDRSLLGYLWVEKNTEEPLEALRNFRLQPHFQQIMQLLASDGTTYVNHLPMNQQVFRKYETIDILTAFSAFESECHKDRVTFIQTSVDFSEVKAEIETLIGPLEQKYPLEKYSVFFKSLYDRIRSIGVEFGEKQRVINAYQVCLNILEGTTREYPKNDNIQIAAERIVKMRNKAIHHNYFPDTDNGDNICIELLHLIYYAMVFRRAGVPDDITELSLDDVFHCNNKLLS